MRRTIQSNWAAALLIGSVAALCLSVPAAAQERDWETLLEQLATDEDESTAGWERFYDELCELQEHPLNLNTATQEELERLPFLTPQQVEGLLAYLYRNGPMQTLGELQLVEELDFQTRKLLRFFVYAGAAETGKRPFAASDLLRYGQQQLLARLDVPLYRRAGYRHYSDSILQRYPNRKYLGDPFYHSLRYQYHYRDQVYAGFTAEKDAGERFFAHGHKGYDFYAYYLLLQHMGWLQTLALGSYRLSFGQGLVMNTNFSLGKSAALSSLWRQNKGIKKHASTDEANYLQGAAAAVALGRLTLTAFYSYRKLDATLKQDSSVCADPFVSSLVDDGLHRTPLEVSKRHNTRNRLAGGNLSYTNNGFHIGATAVQNRFNRLLEPGDAPYRRYYPRGKEFGAYGVDYSLYRAHLMLAGETAYSRGGGVAALHTVQWEVANEYKLLLIHRYYAKNYHGLYANAFSESSEVRNEHGIYAGVECQPLAALQVSGYVDFFRFPYIRYQASAPSSRGMDGMVQAVWRGTNDQTLLLKYRYKNKGKDFKLTANGKKGIDQEVQHRLRLQWKRPVSAHFHLQTTADYAQVRFITLPAADCGYMLSESLHCTLQRPFPLSAHLSAGYFHTDSYASRLYAYEKGLLYSFSFPSFYGHGVRLAALLRCEWGSRLLLTVKYGHTRYFDRNRIGSSQQEIAGRRKQDVQLQLCVKI